MPATVTILVQRLPHGEQVELPQYMTPGAAAADVRAAIEQPMVIEPGGIALVPTGFAIELPQDFELQIRPRSGLAVKHGITVLNSPGTIDSDYRGEVMVLLINLGAEPFTIVRGERIAQLVVQRVEQAELVKVKAVGATARGAGGFGSTGRKGTARTKTPRPNST